MRLVIGCLLASWAAGAHGADRDLKSWTMQSLGRSCEVHTFAYGAGGGDNRMLFIKWAPGKAYELSAWGPVVDGSVIIEAVGTTDSFKVSPVDQHHLLTGSAVRMLVADLAQGAQIRLTEKTAAVEAPAVFVTQGSNSPQATRALVACADMLERQPVPLDAIAERGHYIAAGGPDECKLERYWRTAEAAFSISLETTGLGSSVEFARVLSMHGYWPTHPFAVDARNFFGGKSSDMRAVRIGLSAAQIEELEGGLQAGELRTADLSLPGFPTDTLTFGSPLARAPAAMFNACRKSLSTEPAAADHL